MATDKPTKDDRPCIYCYPDENGETATLDNLSTDNSICDNPYKPGEIIIFVDGEAMLPIEFCPKCGRKFDGPIGTQ